MPEDDRVYQVQRLILEHLKSPSLRHIRDAYAVKSKELYCRMNGRTYQLSPTPDKMWTLRRIASVGDEAGVLIGKYRYRRDVTKVLAEVAYRDEPRR